MRHLYSSKIYDNPLPRGVFVPLWTQGCVLYVRSPKSVVGSIKDLISFEINGNIKRYTYFFFKQCALLEEKLHLMALQKNWREDKWCGFFIGNFLVWILMVWQTSRHMKSNRAWQVIETLKSRIASSGSVTPIASASSDTETYYMLSICFTFHVL